MIKYKLNKLLLILYRCLTFSSSPLAREVESSRGSGIRIGGGSFFISLAVCDNNSYDKLNNNKNNMMLRILITTYYDYMALAASRSLPRIGMFGGGSGGGKRASNSLAVCDNNINDKINNNKNNLML